MFRQKFPLRKLLPEIVNRSSAELIVNEKLINKLLFF